MALSSIELEYKAVSQVGIEIAWLRSLLREIQVHFYSLAVVWSDNVSLGALASNLVFHSWMKHIEIDVYFIKEQEVVRILEVQYVPTEF